VQFASSDSVPRRPWWFSRALRALTSPFYRYRNAKLIHSVRVGLAMLVSILVTTGIHIPGGGWASVTVLVVIGGIQHHGNIRKKAAERTAGTLLGALVGLLLIVTQMTTGASWLTYLLMSVVAGVCGYYAIGKPGYIALLTVITMCIVGGHGDNSFDTGLWRVLNVLIGNVIALAFSFVLPLHATYSWRYQLADNLRGCARVHTQIASGQCVDKQAQLATFRRLGERLVRLRSLMPSVAREINVPVARLEQVQWLQRSMLSALEMMSDVMNDGPQHRTRTTFAGRDAAVRAWLLTAARALRFGGAGRGDQSAADALRPAANEGQPMQETYARSDLGGDPLAPALQGPHWLALRFEEQVQALRAVLLEIEPNWNIERRPAQRRG
jgi:uncharacterized membrane protein YccC